MIAKGVWHALKLAERIANGAAPDVPPLAARAIAHLAEHIHALQSRIADLDRQLRAWVRGNEVAKRLETLPGIGVLTASAKSDWEGSPRWASGIFAVCWSTG